MRTQGWELSKLESDELCEYGKTVMNKIPDFLNSFNALSSHVRPPDEFRRESDWRELCVLAGLFMVEVIRSAYEYNLLGGESVNVNRVDVEFDRLNEIIHGSYGVTK